MLSSGLQDEQAAPWVDGLTIGQVLRETARRYPKNDAFVFCEPDARMTWEEFDRAVDQAARGLLSLGFEPGDHFGIWATNVPEWVLLQFATARIGVVLVTINPSYRISELRYALQQSEVRGLALIDGFKKSHFFQILDETSGQGLQADFSITNFSRNEALEEAITVSVTAKVTYSATAPSWIGG